MTAAGTDRVPAMTLALCASFGSVAQWRDDFARHARHEDVGQAALLFDARTGALANRWLGAPAATDPNTLLVLATPAGDAQVESFLARPDWAQAYETYQRVVHDSSEPWAAEPSHIAGAVLLDVRRAGVFEQAKTMLPTARWQDPAQVASWGAALPKDRPVLVYCVYGHEVGRATALRLRALGVDARFLPGGIDAWQSADKPVVARASAE